MALVAYGSSDESDNEDSVDKSCDKGSNPCVELNNQENNLNARSGNKNYVNSDRKEIYQGNVNLFACLPAPVIGTDQEVNNPTNSENFKGHKHVVKISVPALSEFKDVDLQDPPRKKLKPSQKVCGLFALLPAPKNSSVKEAKRSFVPNVLSRKRSDVAPDILQLGSSKSTFNISDYEGSNNEYTEEKSSENPSENDFFSLSYNNKEDDNFFNYADIEEGKKLHPKRECINNINDQIVQSSSDFPPSMPADIPCPDNGSVGPSNISEGNTIQLDEKALQMLCGRRGKKMQETMELIEVSGDAIMPDPKEWLTKQITQEQKMKSHSHRRNEGPTTQQRRKHQITYLAFQAKENELELKNQWSQNRMSRKQTQSKYGF